MMANDSRTYDTSINLTYIALQGALWGGLFGAIYGLVLITLFTLADGLTNLDIVSAVVGIFYVAGFAVLVGGATGVLGGGLIATTSYLVWQHALGRRVRLESVAGILSAGVALAILVFILAKEFPALRADAEPVIGLALFAVLYLLPCAVMVIASIWIAKRVSTSNEDLYQEADR